MLLVLVNESCPLGCLSYQQLQQQQLQPCQLACAGVGGDAILLCACKEEEEEDDDDFGAGGEEEVEDVEESAAGGGGSLAVTASQKALNPALAPAPNPITSTFTASTRPRSIHGAAAL